METTKEKIEEARQSMINSRNNLERHCCVRLLMAYQCIKCGNIFDDEKDLIEHWIWCK